MFNVLGDREIWNLQVKCLEKILPKMKFSTKAERLKSMKQKTEVVNDWCTPDYYNLPLTDLSDVSTEFKKLTDHFQGLRRKYIFGNQSGQSSSTL
jgi:hypothetical protein